LLINTASARAQPHHRAALTRAFLHRRLSSLSRPLCVEDEEKKTKRKLKLVTGWKRRNADMEEVEKSTIQLMIT
jgi:hypothetical protein